MLIHTVTKAVGLSAIDKLVLTEIARRADKRNRAVAAQTEIARVANVSLRSVSKSVLSLKAQGWITVEVRHRRDGRRGFNVYTITDPIAQMRAMEADKRLPLLNAINKPASPHKELIKSDQFGHVESFDFRARRRW